MIKERVITNKLGLIEYWRDFCQYRELMWFLTQRDLSVRYKQTLAGGLWAVMVPLLSVVALTFVFKRVAGLAAEGSSYTLMVYAAMMPWQIFTNAIQAGGTSLLTSTSLVTKLYFPRVILPLATQGVSVVDWALNFVIFLCLGPFLGLEYSWRLLTMPLWVALALWVSAGPMLILASWLIKYRDLRFVIPFVVQFGLLVTPVGFASSVVPAAMKGLFVLNPLVGTIEGFRWALLGQGAFPAEAVGWALVMSSLIMVAALASFLKAERTMADEL